MASSAHPDAALFRQEWIFPNRAWVTCASMLQQGQTSVTPEQAANVVPGEVQALAEHVHSQNPGIVGEISNIYAEHPAAIKALGAAALAMAMKYISENQG